MQTFNDEYKVNINSIARELKKDSLSLKNRLQSIFYDGQYIEQLREKNIAQYPLVSNERCGSWYVPPQDQIESCYFKSTDGHTGHWQFSHRRMNLHLIDIIIKNQGISIIDSTRKGKLMPDALSKTIPIWCAVLNYIRFKDENINVPTENWLFVPSEIISDSEYAQMVSKIPEFAQQVESLGILSQEKLKDLRLDKPLIPDWIYENKKDCPTINVQSYHIQCITASKSRGTPSYYVQGAADDHELWLTNEICEGKFDPKFLWEQVANCDSIVNEKKLIHDNITEEELVHKLNSLYINYKKKTGDLNDKWFDVTQVKNSVNDTKLLFGQIKRNVTFKEVISDFPDCGNVIVLSEFCEIKDIPQSTTIKIQQFKIPDNKIGSKTLRQILPQIDLEINNLENCKLVLCDSGKDLSAAVILMSLSSQFDFSWKHNKQKNITKDTVKRHLTLLQDVRKINPRRNTLQSVNAYLFQ